MIEAQRKASKKWDDANRDRKNYINKRSIAKNFILKSANHEDLKKMSDYIDQRKKLLHDKD